MGDTARKGDIGLAQAIAAFTRVGFNVSIPISESLGYDLIVEQNLNLYKVQVKFSTIKCVDLRGTYTNTKETIMTYPNGSFDWLYVFYDDNDYLIKDSLIGRSTVSVNEFYKMRG